MGFLQRRYARCICPWPQQRYLQRQLDSGELAAGQKLPSNTELARQWGVSCTDVQRAMSRLTAIGLIERAPRRGTFVRSNTQKVLLGILSKQSMSDETAYFARALIKALQWQIEERRFTCRVYDSLGNQRSEDGASYANGFPHFANDLRHYSFKGLIELNSDLTYPRHLKSQIDLPRVRYGVPARRPDPKDEDPSGT